MKNNFGLEEQTIQNLKKIFSQNFKVRKVLLYGSRAMGTYKKNSDIDLTILANEMDLTELLKIENEIDDLFMPYKVDLCLFHQIDNKNLIDHINRVGITFFERKSS